ncbi:hypothetical protein Tco_0998068, partial [Tanacetum coccineum]
YTKPSSKVYNITGTLIFLWDLGQHLETAKAESSQYFIYQVDGYDKAPLPHRDLRHTWLRYQVDGMSDTEIGLDVADTLCFSSMELGGGWRRKSGAQLSGGHFIGRLAAYFGLISDEGLRGLSVALGPERQQAATGGALTDVEGAPAADEGAQVVPLPVQAPQPSPPAPQPQTMS